MKYIFKKLYDIDHVLQDNGDLALYLTLKSEFENAGFAQSYQNVVQSKQFDKLEIPEIDRAKFLLFFGLLEFEESEYLEILYIKAAESCILA
jgi:hypothetical protein